MAAARGTLRVDYTMLNDTTPTSGPSGGIHDFSDWRNILELARRGCAQPFRVRLRYAPMQLVTAGAQLHPTNDGSNTGGLREASISTGSFRVVEHCTVVANVKYNAGAAATAGVSQLSPVVRVEKRREDRTVFRHCQPQRSIKSKDRTPQVAAPAFYFISATSLMDMPPQGTPTWSGYGNAKRNSLTLWASDSRYCRWTV